ncbi:MAG: hypothetical protein BroJett007_34800 [Chloroflexota bacterium]|nr:MAG: hypothetical protein BroJett007_34800 [Chloroflexota bacterium]
MISPKDFVERWEKAELREQQAAQSHFNELCQLVNQKTPTERDPKGEFFTFEQHVTKEGGGAGRADVWLKGHFAWEYKGKLKDLDAAYNQLLAYRSDLDNPPLLVVSDMLEYRIYPQFTNLSGQPIKFHNRDLLDEKTRDFIRWLLTDPEQFRQYLEQQRRASESLTEKLAHEFAELARLMREHPTKSAPKWEPMQIARFLTKLVFALFAEDVGLMPEPFDQPVFRYLVEGVRHVPESFVMELRRLFEAMNGATPQFVSRLVPYFDGGLFNESAPGADDGLEVLDLTEIPGAIDLLEKVAERDWRKVDPTIFGNLFEGALDESKRAQLGAHYTSEKDIRLVIDPVLMAPLLREWETTRIEAEPLLQTFLTSDSPRSVTQAETRLKQLRDAFYDRLSSVTVLDPACGSGNFLYVSLKAMKDLERRARELFQPVEPGYFRDGVTPRQFYGIEKDPFAARLAHVVLWIGYLQWRYEDEGILHWQKPRQQPHPRALPKPILDDRDAPDAPPRILNDDAILRYDADGKPYEPEWPAAEVIVGNPPFLGGKIMRSELGDDYVDTLFAIYKSRVPPEADLVTYWFEKARAKIESSTLKRAGLIATNSIRGGANRKVLDRIKETTDIFAAWSDNPWILAGAAVRISIVGFGSNEAGDHMLDGKAVKTINSNLELGLDAAAAQKLAGNFGIAFMGVTPAGPFDVPEEQARRMLAMPNRSGAINADVVRRYFNAEDITSRSKERWIIDFGVDLPIVKAQEYEAPFRHVTDIVLPVRLNSRQPDREKRQYWIFTRARPEMRKAISKLPRYLATPMVAKHRVFVWLDKDIIPANLINVIARSDDYFFGVLHAYPHEIWSLRLGTSLEDRPRYTPTTTFETYPFPWPPGQEPGAPETLTPSPSPSGRGEDDARGGVSPLSEAERGFRGEVPSGDAAKVQAIAIAAARLHKERDAWLNPPDLLALDLSGDSKEIKERTLTNLYNAVAAARGSTEKLGKLVDVARKFAPRMIELHDALDAAVLSAYGWDDLLGRLRTPDGDEELLRRLLAENQRRAAEQR